MAISGSIPALLRRALDTIKATPAIKGVLITSAKDNFIVGADIFEFTRLFKQPETDIAAFVAANSDIITALGDLPVPTVAAINGLALGGGLEVALAADYRVLSNSAKIGFPEITLVFSPAMAAPSDCRAWPVWRQAPNGSFPAPSKVLIG